MTDSELEIAVKEKIEGYLNMAYRITQGVIGEDSSGSDLIAMAKMIQKEEHRIVDRYYFMGKEE